MRNSLRQVLTLVLFLTGMTTGPAYAGVDEALLQILLQNGAITQQQYEQLKSQPTTETAGAARSEEIKAAVKDTLPSWVERFKPNADFRLRHDWQSFDTPGPDVADRNRERIRARFGFTFDVNDYTRFGVQLATGGDDPVSTNQTLDNRFDSKTVVIDLAYIEQKAFNNKFTFYGGQFKNPFHGYSFITFDPDLRFDGIAGQYDFGNGLAVNAGLFPLDEVKTKANDPWLIGAQGVYDFKLADAASGSVALSYYDYSNVENITIGTQATNTETAFKILNPHIIIETHALPIYAGLQFDYLNNLDANTDGQGFLIGAKLGHKKIKKLKDWQLFGTYSRLEANAQYDEFSDSDFHSGGTNNRGFTVGYKIGLGKGWEHDFKYYNTHEITGPTDKEQRIQADLKYKF